WKGDSDKLARIAEALGVNIVGMTTEEAAKAAVNEVYRLVEDLDVPSLEEQGVSPELIDRLAEEAMKDPQTVGNPRDLSVKDYVWIYERCFDLTPKTV